MLDALLRWINDHSQLLSWTVISGIAGIIGGATAGIAGAVAWGLKFREEREQHREERNRHLRIMLRESQKTFLDRQLQLYFEAVKTVAQLGILTKGRKFDELKQKFWELYWGELSVVESQDVENKMVVLGEILNALEFTRTQPKEAAIEHNKSDRLKELLNNAGASIDANLTVGEIEQRLFDHLQWTTFELAHTMRESLKEGWAVDLPEINATERNRVHTSQ